LDVACFTHLQFLALGSEHLKLKSKFILGLGLGASETEINVHYRQLACKYHSDKNDPAITGLTATEASAFFQLLNNAQEYLKDCT
jgi:DnaJ-class molecular chaperone